MFSNYFQSAIVTEITPVRCRFLNCNIAISFLAYLARASSRKRTYAAEKFKALSLCPKTPAGRTRRGRVHRSIAVVDRGRAIDQSITAMGNSKATALSLSLSRIVPRGFMRVGHARSATGLTCRTCTHSGNSLPLSPPVSPSPPFHSRNLSDRRSTPSRFRRWPIFDYLDACHPAPYYKLIASNWKTFSGYPVSLASSALSIVNLTVSRQWPPALPAIPLIPTVGAKRYL